MQCFAVVLLVAVVASGCGGLDAAAVGEDQLVPHPIALGRRLLAGMAGRHLSTTGDDPNAPQREYYADYEIPAPPSLMECTGLLTKEVANWSVPYQQANFNTTFQNLLIHFIKTSSSSCFSGHAHGTTELIMYADLTWVYASQQQMLTMFLAENPQVTADFHEKFFFQSLADIAVEPVANSPDWYISDADSQASEYSGTLQFSTWSGPLYAVDNAAALLTTRPVGLLFPRTNLLLFYRRDLLEANNLQVPATWVDLITTAAALNGTNFTDSGPGGGYGICLDLGQRCKSNFLLMAIAGSLVQSRGLHQGLYIDPVTMQPLANNAAMVEAMRIFAALTNLSNPESQDACTGWNEYFQQGQCAMTIEWDFSLRWAAQDASKVKGRLGVSLLPGSTQVLDRLSGLLLPCTAFLCPHATLEFVLAPESSLPPASRPALASTAATLVNRMPFSTMCEVVTSISQKPGTLSATAPVQVALLTFLNSYLNPPIQFLNTRQLISNLAYDTLLGATPRYDAPPAFNVSTQVQHNFNATDLQEYYPVLWAARYHPNAGGDVASLGNVLIRVAIEEALYNVTRLFQDAAVVLPILSTRYGLVIASLNVSDADFFTSYSRTIHYVPPPPSALSMGAASRTEITTVVATVVCVGGLLLLLLIGLVVFQLRMRRRTLLGKVTAPGCGEDTTLLCTDIQNSTLLWETIEAAIMDVAINTHHALLRKCMNRRGGYLSACEGDSFIIAFHHPRAAVFFAMDAQTELMQAKWSPELLLAPDCVPVFAVIKRDEPSSSLRPASSSGVPALAAGNGGGGASRSSSKSLGPLHGVTAARSQAANLGRHLASMLMHRPLLRRWGSTDQTLVGTANINAQVTNWSKSLGLCATPAFGGAASMHGGSPTLGGMGGGGASNHVYGPSSDAQVKVTSAGGRPSAAARDAARHTGPAGRATQPAWTMFNPMHRTPSMTDASSPDLTLLEQGLTQRMGSAPCMDRKSISVPRAPRTASTASRLERLSAAAVRQVRRPPAGARAVAEGLEPPTTTVLEDDALCRMAIEMGSAPPTAVSASPQLGVRPLSLLQIPSFGRDRAGGGPSVAFLTKEAPRRSSAHVLGQLDTPTSRLGQPAFTFPFISAALASSGGAPDVSSSAGSPSTLPLSAMSPTTGGHNVHLMAALLAPGSNPMTWQDLMRSNVEAAGRSNSGVINSPGSRNAPVSTLVYNGLRVRMGMYSGIASSDDIVYNRAAGNVQYSGDAMEGAKAICSAAHGGMVLVAGETYRRLLPSQVMRHALLVYAGDFHLDDIRRTWQVYQAALVCLPQRMALSEPVRCVKQLQLGTCSAPVGCVTIAFMYVVGATTLLNEVPEEARRALAICHAAVTEELLRWGGYLVEAVDGLVLAAFGNTCSAACWGLACQQHMLRQPWSAELLAQECCEEVFTVERVASVPRDAAGLVHSHCATASFTSLTAGGAARGARSMSSVPGIRSTMDGMPPFNALSPLPTRRRVLLRGLRLKVGLDVGNPTPDLNTDSGRMAYRGRVMNRAARIASKASAGRVVCSGGAWDNMLDTPSPALAANGTLPVTAESLGFFELKGLVGALELFDCRHEASEPDDHGWDGPDDSLHAPPSEPTLDALRAALQRIELRHSHLAEVRRASVEMQQVSLQRASLQHSKATAE